MGLSQYFSLPPWGIDVRRAYELMTTLDDASIASISDKDGMKLQVQITEELVSEALKMPTPAQAQRLPHQLNEVEKKVTFRPTNNKETFKDLKDQRMDLPLCLYAHHFAMGKPQRFTHPNKRVAGFIHQAMKGATRRPGNFSCNILLDIQNYKKSKGLQQYPYLAGGLMLTRIAYEAIGTIDELPPALNPADMPPLSTTASPVKVSMIIPPRPQKKKSGVVIKEMEDEEEEESEGEKLTYFRRGGREKQTEDRPPSPHSSSLTAAQKSLEKAKKTLKESNKKAKEQERQLQQEQEKAERLAKAKKDKRPSKVEMERMKALDEQEILAKQGRAFIQEQMAKEAHVEVDPAPLIGTKRTSEEMRDNLKDFNAAIKRLKKMTKEKTQTSSPLNPIIEEAEHEQELPSTPPLPQQSQEETSSQQQTSEQLKRVVDSWILNTPPSSTKIPTTEVINEEEVQSQMEPLREVRTDTDVDMTAETSVPEEEHVEVEQREVEISHSPPQPEQLYEEVKIPLYRIYKVPIPQPIILRRVKMTKKMGYHFEDIPSGIELKIRDAAEAQETELIDLDKDEAEPNNINEPKDEYNYEETIEDHLHMMGLRMQIISNLTCNKEEEMDKKENLQERYRQTNKAQVDEINHLREEVWIKTSQVQMEAMKTNDLKEESQAMEKRALRAEADQRESQRQVSQIKAALNLANERRAAAEATLNQILDDPVLSAPASSSATNSSLKATNEALQSQIKAKDLQIELLTSGYLAKEKAMEEANNKMKEELAKMKKELEEAKAGSSEQHQQEQEPPKMFHFEMEVPAPDTEEVYIELPKDDTLEQLSQEELELASLIEENLEPTQKSCMEWEKRILHSSALCFPNRADATKAYNRAMIPYALIKHELIKTKERLTTHRLSTRGARWISSSISGSVVFKDKYA